MSDGARLYRYAVTFEPLFALHELEPEIADDELLALGGTRTLIVCAASQDQAGEIASAIMEELRPELMAAAQSELASAPLPPTLVKLVNGMLRTRGASFQTDLSNGFRVKLKFIPVLMSRIGCEKNLRKIASPSPKMLPW